MYFYLTGAIKRKIIRELKFCFSHLYPEHQDILEYINHKYAFKNRPQKGIIVSGVSAAPMRLSSDNFVGTVVSHVMLANLDGRKGLSIEWVREDLRRIDQNGGHFPSPPGIYYIEVYDGPGLKDVMGEADFDAYVQKQGGEEYDYYFYVDPLLIRKTEMVISPRGEALLGEPVYPQTLRLWAGQQELMSGQGLYLENEKPFEIRGKNISLLGLPGSKPSWSRLVIGGKTYYDLGTDQEMVIQAGPEIITVTFDDPDEPENPPFIYHTPQQVVRLIQKAFAEALHHEDFRVRQVSSGDIYLESRHALEVKGGTALAELGLEPGQKAPYVIEGDIFHPYMKGEVELYIRVFETDGSYEETQDPVRIGPGPQSPEAIAERMDSLENPSLDKVEACDTGDYVITDHDVGEIRFLRPFPEDAVIRAQYKTPAESHGPYPIRKEHSNNTAIPGVVIAFGRRVVAGDKMAIVVQEERVPVAAEYGGRWEMGVDLDIITRDPMVREELSDLILMYFFALRKERLTEEGLEITDVSFGGESEEVYDDTAQDYYFNSQISISFQTDWAVHVPYPLYIERLEQTSFATEAQYAGTGQAPPLDIFKPLEIEELQLKRVGHMYLKGMSRDFERIR